MGKPSDRKAAENMLRFIAAQSELVAGRLETCGCAELAQGMREVAVTVGFFHEEFEKESERHTGNRLPLSVT